MKLTVARKEFADALKNVLKAVAVKTQTPILAGVYFKAESSTLELQATDHSLGIVSKVAANVEESGETAIVGKKLFEIVLKLSGDTLTITSDDTKAEIKSAGTKYNLVVLNPADFPKIKQEESTKEILLRQRNFKNLLKKTTFAAADDKETSRPIFTGVLFKVEGENLTLAATNTHRLAVVTEKISEVEGNLEYLIPAKTLQEISTMLDEVGEIKISFSDKNAFFAFNNFLVTTRLISGNFPDFSKLLNEKRSISVTVSPQDFLQALERVAIIAKETKYNTADLDFADNEIKISSTSADVGKAEENVPAEIEGGEFTRSVFILQISFNCKYLTDVLKVIDAEKIKIGMSGALAPLDFQENNFRYIVTPVRRN